MLHNSFENNKIVGLKRGIVKDLKDPDKLNRVKVTLVDESLETPFADVMAKFAGEKYGSVFIPSKGEEVIVGFLDGKINDPVILGSLYNSKNQPPINVDEKNEIMFIQFPAGLKIEIDNKKDSQKITLTTKKGHIVSLDDGSNEQVLINEKSGKTSFKVDFKKGEIELKADKKICLSAGQDTLSVEKQKGVSLSSSAGKLNINVNSANLKSKSNIVCEAGAKFTAKGNAGAEINSPAQTVIKGAMTKIN